MYDEFEAFLENPTDETYRRARRAVLNGPDGRPSGLELAKLSELYEGACWAEVCRAADEMTPRWALCPRLHYFAAAAAAELGDEEEAELRRFLLASCLQGLLATGDGGPDHPYLATYSTDEHDLLRALGLRARGQELVRHGSGRFDVISCEDGSEIWFDVTESVTCIGPVVERHAAVLGGDG